MTHHKSAWYYPGTNGNKGFHMAIEPGERSELKFLSYGRIILNPGESAGGRDLSGKEAVILGISGKGTVLADGREYTIGKHDSIYMPKGTEFSVKTGEGCDFCYLEAPSNLEAEIDHVPFEKVKDVKDLHFSVGEQALSNRREVYTTIGHNVKAERLVVGFTYGESGNWTSWPPHEHAATREEIYIFFDMPEPGFGVQFVFTDPKDMELVIPVRDGDAVCVPRGYHPNVGAPGCKIAFIWAMAAIEPVVDRDYMRGVKVLEDYKDVKFID